MRKENIFSKILRMRKTMLSIVVIDSHPLMRTALSTALATEEDLQVVAEYPNGKQFFEKRNELEPNIVLFGIGNPPNGELEIIRTIRESFPAIIILALVTGELPGQDQAAFQAGANFVLEKTLSRVDLLGALNTCKRELNLIF